MKVLSFAALPFHAWCLDSTEAALVRKGVEVVRYVHEPKGPHDWATLPLNLSEARQRIGTTFDAVLCADYPYGPLRAAFGAPVVSVRHSLAARGNTYEPEQAEADLLAGFSSEDDRLLLERAGVDPSKLATTGCPWARLPFGSRGPTHNVLLWAPTWNRWLSSFEMQARIVERAAEAGWDVRLRMHAATEWREGASLLDGLRRQIPTLLTSETLVSLQPETHPALALADCTVLLTDVSGIALLAPFARRPVVCVDPVGPGAQIQPWGPEWTHRAALGRQVAANAFPDVVDDVVEKLGELLPAPVELRHQLCRATGRQAAEALAHEIVRRFG